MTTHQPNPYVAIERQPFYRPGLGSAGSRNSDAGMSEDRHPVEHIEDANVISSHVVNKPGVHAPVLDIDLPCHLTESETPGHYHLYINVEMSWDQYSSLLAKLAEVGICQPGYVGAALDRGATFVATQPWKGPE